MRHHRCTASQGPAVPADGPLRILVVTPWCPDCEEGVPRLASKLAAKRTVVAGEFAEPFGERTSRAATARQESDRRSADGAECIVVP